MPPFVGLSVDIDLSEDEEKARQRSRQVCQESNSDLALFIGSNKHGNLCSQTAVLIIDATSLLGCSEPQTLGHGRHGNKGDHELPITNQVEHE